MCYDGANEKWVGWGQWEENKCGSMNAPKKYVDVAEQFSCEKTCGWMKRQCTMERATEREWRKTCHLIEWGVGGCENLERSMTCHDPIQVRGRFRSVWVEKNNHNTWGHM